MATTIQYKLKKGDTLAKLGIPEEILKLNPGLSKLSPGTVINIPLGTAGKGMTSGGVSLGNSGFQPGGGGMIPGQVTGGVKPLPGYLPGTSGGKPIQGLPSYLPGTSGGKPYQGGNTLGDHQMGAGAPPSMPTFPTGTHQIGAGGNPNMPTFQTGGRSLPPSMGQPMNPAQGGWNNAVGQGAGFQPGGGGMIPGQPSQWIDFQKMPAGMTWEEYNARLQQAQAEGYRGPFLMPNAQGVGQLMWDRNQPVQGAVYNQNGTVAGIGRGNIQTTGGKVGHSSAGRARASQPSNPANQGNVLGQLLAQQPELANNPLFQQLLGQVGGVAQPGNTGGNNAVNGNMNWRF